MVIRMNTEPPIITPTDAAPELFQQVGLITRQLHDTLNQLGVMPKLLQSADALPNMRSRLHYVATKTQESAEKVLDLVDLAKREQLVIASATRSLASGTEAVLPAIAEQDTGLPQPLQQISDASTRTDAILTDIMLAQDFHDLTSQVVAKVVRLAIDLEDSLVKLLVRNAPSELTERFESNELAGPVIDPTKQVDVVSSQGEVDDLLASLGF